MTPFHVGMKVVCVNEAWSRKPIQGETVPTLGGVYTIRSMHPYIQNRVQLQFVEIVNPKIFYGDAGICECHFNSVAFRPAHENRMDELRTLLAPVPSKAKTRVKA